MKKPTQNEPTSGELSQAAADRATEWDMFPLASIAFADPIPVQSLTGAKGLKRGATYYLTQVSSKGLVAVVGGTQAYPMDYFRRGRTLPRQQAEGIDGKAQ